MADDYPVEGVPPPDPSYDPETVVTLQLDALATNDDPRADAGIDTAYNFASPANRRSTGPLERFRRMVRSPTYAPMIDHQEATRGPLERSSDRAEQRVTLTGPEGRTVTYVFGLSLAGTDPVAGCWVTDRVLVE